MTESDVTSHYDAAHNPWNPDYVTGHPAVAVPCGFTASGMPIGIEFVGQPFGETDLLRLAHAYEQATPWHERWARRGAE